MYLHIRCAEPPCESLDLNVALSKYVSLHLLHSPSPKTLMCNLLWTDVHKCMLLNRVADMRFWFWVAEITHVKTSVPHPAVRVRRRGPRSRAGLIPPPQFEDMDWEIPVRTTAVRGGAPGQKGEGLFRRSSRGWKHIMIIPVPTN